MIFYIAVGERYLSCFKPQNAIQLNKQDLNHELCSEEEVDWPNKGY